ncbi:TerY-C metal binding domain-containing protein [Chitinophaga nivalis]|uniref:VWA domain-containing protein n=1 Tax=Chitinophaga nivalis TaxID=2991709 RepID=A0ABT3IJ74_9BACT|nr:TerY-C metal binding domain-containing protein [Chitinophaga nivalis]MCW3466315.1 VWA domain-containing protein [Chitinophaga nivalis]MCW3483994.1 VWA domain-containing protein [Chitinophaga nivalis]
MRRLPIYFLIDVSESMVGEPIQQVEEGLSQIIQALKADPYAIETVWISIIVFAGQAKTLVPLQEIITFYPPRFPIGGGTSLSKGLGHLMYELRKNQVKTTYEQKGDWKPIVFLFTDGVPTDDTKAVIAEWKQSWQRTANMVAVSFGDEADAGVLRELTENVMYFRNSDAAAYKQFFKWVTDSIKTSSESVEKNAAGFELAKIHHGDTLSKIDLSKPLPPKQYTDSNYAVLVAKCQNMQRPYLMKYRRSVKDAELYGLNLNTMSYKLVGAFQVDNAYYELSDNSAGPTRINSDELIGNPTCPCCGNQIAFAMCSCGQIHCIGEEKVSTCPWCGNKGTYGIGEGGFDVNRTQG